MKDLFLKRKQAFRKECLGYLRYVLNDHFVLFLLVLLGFLAYQYSQLLQHFPENHWPILLFVGITSVLLFTLGRNCHLYGGSRQALSLSWRRGNQAPSQASNWHFPSLLALCTDPFLAVICAFIFSNGLWLASFSALCAFIGGRKIFPLSSKGQQIFH